MKNKKMAILAFASCVMLAGCGDEATIEIKNIPSNIFVGDVVDLAEYISVANGEGGYSINYSDETLEKIDFVDGSETKFEVLDLGPISFTVDYSGIEKEGHFEVASKVLNSYASQADAAGYAFSLYELDENGQAVSWIEQGPKFYMENLDEKGGVVPYGFVEGPDGVVYSIDIDNVDPIEYHLGYTSNAPLSIGEVSFEYCLTSDLLSAYMTTDSLFGEGATEVLYSDDPNVVAEAYFKICGEDVSEMASYGYTVNKVLVEEYPSQDEDDMSGFVVYFNAIKKSNKKEVLWDFRFVNFDAEELVSTPIISSILDEGLVVEKPDISIGLGLIADAFADRNFTATYDYGWYSYDKSGLFKYEENPLYEEGDFSSIPCYLNAIGSFTYIQTPTQTYCENEKKEGLVIHEDEAYKYYFDGEQYSAIDLHQEDFFDADIPSSFKFMCEKDLFEDVFANYMENEVDGDTRTLYVGWSALSSNELVRTILYYAIPQNQINIETDVPESYVTLDRVIKLFIEQDDYVQEPVGLMDYFDVDCTLTISTAGGQPELTHLTAAFEFVWTYDQKTYAPICYNIYIDFDFGNAVIPSGINIVYPTK